MHIIIAGGTGFIGQTLIADLLKRGINVSVIGRSEAKIKHLFPEKVKALTWQQLQPGTSFWQIVQAADVLINLNGASIGSKRWSAKRKQEILNSRVQPTELLASLCAECGTKAPVLLNASAIGVYGLQSSPEMGMPPALNENEPVSLNSPPDFLAQVARLWENATTEAELSGVRVVLMRFAVVLGRNGGILSQLRLPYKLGLGGKIGSGKQPFCWVAIDDLIKAIFFIIEHSELRGPVNIVSPGIVTQEQFTRALAKELHRPCFFTMPSWLIKLLFGQMGKELLLEGQYVVPKVLLDKGFSFDYPELPMALAHIYRNT